MITALDKNTALVLIDLQKGIVKAETAHPIQSILAKAAELVNVFHDTGLPVVIVHVNPAGAAWTEARAEQTAPKATQFPADFTDTVPEIPAAPDDIFITKKTWNAFFNTSLHDELQKRNITQIVLGGVSTSIGVEGTARAASELGYNIAFATDAMTDRVGSAHEHSLKVIFPRIGEQGTTADIIGFLAKREA